MGFFGNKRKKIVITGTVCQVCGMSFTATDRLARHMTKAHGKVKRDSGTIITIPLNRLKKSIGVPTLCSKRLLETIPANNPDCCA